ncbi:MAG: transglycosylase SLT domain-containing protein [Thermodesulfovibrionales bacterium]|nr:transglycosylase SLT domain-containing protein [Thermodesulfovibrionales bacterium]
MVKLWLLIIYTIILFLVLPVYPAPRQNALPLQSPQHAQAWCGVYASEVNQDRPVEQPVISSLPEEAKDSSAILSDYNNNELAIKAVEKNIGLFQRMKERFSLWLSRSGKYIELMKEILKEKDIPEEIVFLPLIESGFNPHAYSPRRATGYWQFIASTAKKYGLEINWWRDERRDPVKSTMAAADYLKDLYDMFGSWNLAMAAYNAGEGKILKALHMTKTDDYWSLLDSKYLKRETKDYVPKFIAASLIAKSPQEFGFGELEYHLPLDYDEVTIDLPIDLEVAAECAETTLEVIKGLNPELRRWCTPPDVSEYTLRIPEGKKDIFLQKLSQIPSKKRFSIDRYTVKKGDTLKRISKKTGIPLHVILDLNSMEKIIPLKAGMKIYLPPKGKFVLDRDDRAIIKKASFKQKNKGPKTRHRHKRV